MKRSGKCPKCGGTDILPGVKVEDKAYGARGLEQTLVTYGNPSALVFTERHDSKVCAWVCGSCGFVEFYAASVEDLKLGVPP